MSNRPRKTPPKKKAGARKKQNSSMLSSMKSPFHTDGQVKAAETELIENAIDFEHEQPRVLPAREVARRPLSRRLQSRQNDINNVVAFLLVMIVLIAPIPIGSNRPVFWMISAAIIGVVGSAYFGLLAYRDLKPRFGTSSIKLLAAAIAVYVAYLVAQIIPWGRFISGFDIAIPAGGAFLSETMSIAPQASLLSLFRTISYIIFFALFLQVAANRDRARKIGWALFIGVAAHAVWAMMSLLGLAGAPLWSSGDSYADVATGTFINRNSFATFMGFGAVLGLALLSNHHPRKTATQNPLILAIQAESLQRYVLYLLAVVIAVALLSSQSRMGLFAAAVACGLTISIGFMKRREMTAIQLLQVAMMIAFAALVVAVLFGRGLLERAIFVENDGNTRAALYDQVFELIASRPWVGYGMDNFELAFPLFHRTPVNVELVWDKAHSTYLTLWSEMGLIFGSIPILMCGYILYRSVNRVLKGTQNHALPLAAIGVIVLAAIHSLVDFSLEIQANVFLFIAILALGLAGQRRSGARKNTVGED